ncbi:hypothetical protein KEJ44_04720 [Candidatus Bathyarchaeota archaeon]|nr:hypothetical protein [Candidatus Bathyarchaeota archaeon]
MDRRVLVVILLAVIAASTGLGYSLWKPKPQNITYSTSFVSARATSTTMVEPSSIEVKTTLTSTEATFEESTKTMLMENLPPEGFLKYLFTINSTWARMVNGTKLCMEDGILIPLERKFLLDPARYSEQLKLYYLSELERASPELADELRKIPESDSVEAVEALEDIAYLRLLSENPDVEEAFNLMVKYGRPDPSSFGYKVPKWNAELLGLYQLAEDEEFQRNDLVALSIAIVDGVFRVIGDEAVQNQVRADDREMLWLGREIIEWQVKKGMTPLSDLPLDAMLYWAWRGTTTMCRGGYWALGGGPYPLQAFMKEKMTLEAYLWDTTSPDTLKEMRIDAERLGWCKGSDVNSIVASIEEYFYFSGYKEHWRYHYTKSKGASDTIMDVDGVDVEYGEVVNVDWQYHERFKKNQPCVGCCVAEVALVDSWLKSLGISANSIARWPLSGRYIGHNHVIYYEPRSGVWKAYPKQAELGLEQHQMDTQNFLVRKLPVKYCFDSYYMLKLNLKDIRFLFVENGISSDKMQEWLLN